MPLARQTESPPGFIAPVLALHPFGPCHGEQKTVMIRHIRSAVVALALFMLGTAGTGASAAPLFAPAAAALGQVAGTFAEPSQADTFGLSAVTDGASPSAAPSVGSGSAFAGEDGTGDDGRGTAGTAVIPRDESFTAAFDRPQDFSERSFRAPPTTGPPAA